MDLSQKTQNVNYLLEPEVNIEERKETQETNVSKDLQKVNYMQKPKVTDTEDENQVQETKLLLKQQRMNLHKDPQAAASSDPHSYSTAGADSMALRGPRSMPPRTPHYTTLRGSRSISSIPRSMAPVGLLSIDPSVSRNMFLRESGSMSPRGPSITFPRGPSITSPRSPSITSPGGLSIPSPRGPSITSPRSPSITSPGGLSITSPRGLSITSPRGLSITSPRGSSITSPRGSSITSPRGSSITSSGGSSIRYTGSSPGISPNISLSMDPRDFQNISLAVSPSVDRKCSSSIADKATQNKVMEPQEMSLRQLLLKPESQIGRNPQGKVVKKTQDISITEPHEIAHMELHVGSVGRLLNMGSLGQQRNTASETREIIFTEEQEATLKKPNELSHRQLQDASGKGQTDVFEKELQETSSVQQNLDFQEQDETLQEQTVVTGQRNAVINLHHMYSSESQTAYNKSLRTGLDLRRPRTSAYQPRGFVSMSEKINDGQQEQARTEHSQQAPAEWDRSAYRELLNHPERSDDDLLDMNRTEQEMFRGELQWSERREQAIAERKQERQTLEERDQAASDREKTLREQARAIREQARAVREQARAIREQARAIQEQETAFRERELAFREREHAIREREHAIREREHAIREEEWAARENQEWAARDYEEWIAREQEGQAATEHEEQTFSEHEEQAVRIKEMSAPEERYQQACMQYGICNAELIHGEHEQVVNKREFMSLGKKKREWIARSEGEELVRRKMAEQLKGEADEMERKEQQTALEEQYQIAQGSLQSIEVKQFGETVSPDRLGPFPQPQISDNDEHDVAL